jgi:FlaA1/EpsC-like NDP-sugar epimerase
VAHNVRKALAFWQTHTASPVFSRSLEVSPLALRHLFRLLQIGVDLGVLLLALFLALGLRFEGDIPPEMLGRVVLSTPLVLLAQYGSVVVFGAQRIIWRYFTLRDAALLARSLGLATLCLVGIRTIAGHAPALRLVLVPYGVLAIDAVLAYVGLVGVRALRRLEAEAREQRERKPRNARATRVLLIGAGRGGLFLARELRSRPDQGYVPIGFIDDDEHKLGQVVDGLSVLGTTRSLKVVCEQQKIERLIITVASTIPEEFRRLSDRVSEAGLPVMIVPRLVDLLDGTSGTLRIRDVTIEDLLGRPPVVLDTLGLERFIQGKVVLVSGAGGSIGSELCRQVLHFRPRRLVLLERYENALFEIHRELLELGLPEVELLPRVCDITDASRVDQVFAEQTPQIILHAAAHKHVPMMEENPGEAVKNNVGGTRTLADAAVRHGVHRFVMISTDKAVNPSSIMGATKRVAELYVQHKNLSNATLFSMVRFGNVLGSAGSVVPIFKKQIAKGGPVTVTHPDMVRFFMTIPEASQLVLQAGALSQGGEVYVLDMGAPVRIVELARDLIRLSGFRPDRDIAIEFTGVRPGEKLFEELSLLGKETLTSLHPGIFVVATGGLAGQELISGIDSLVASAIEGRTDEVVLGLRRLVPEFSR